MTKVYVKTMIVDDKHIDAQLDQPNIFNNNLGMW